MPVEIATRVGVEGDLQQGAVKEGQDSKITIPDAKEFSMRGLGDEVVGIPCKVPPCRGCKPACAPPPPPSCRVEMGQNIVPQQDLAKPK